MAAVEVYDCERRARTVAAIKYVRHLHDCGLAEAKLLIDEVYCYRRPVVLEFGAQSEAELFADHMASLGFSCRSVDVRRQTPA
jgi:ribosomal protein L7/L12